MARRVRKYLREEPLVQPALPPPPLETPRAVCQRLALEAVVHVWWRGQFPIMGLPLGSWASVGGRKPRELGKAEYPGDSIPNPRDYAGRCPVYGNEAGMLREPRGRQLWVGENGVHREFVGPGVSSRFGQGLPDEPVQRLVGLDILDRKDRSETCGAPDVAVKTG